MYLRQDYVFFIPPPPHHRGTRSAFSPSIDACWYGRVNLIFKIRDRTDAGPVMDCQCALIETRLLSQGGQELVSKHRTNRNQAAVHALS